VKETEEARRRLREEEEEASQVEGGGDSDALSRGDPNEHLPPREQFYNYNRYSSNKHTHSTISSLTEKGIIADREEGRRDEGAGERAAGERTAEVAYLHSRARGKVGHVTLSMTSVVV
jgi:hypothetical protein